jgi:hypothetical protein
MVQSRKIENNSQSRFKGHVVWVGKGTLSSDKLCRWTLKWIAEQQINIASIAQVDSLEMALESLEAPVRLGNPPEMVIVDRELKCAGIETFSEKVQNCIPECWVVELVSSKDLIQPEGNVIYMEKPINEEDWFDLLRHCFLECPNPQWSKSLG